MTNKLLEVCKLVKYQLERPNLIDTPRLIFELKKVIKILKKEK